MDLNVIIDMFERWFNGEHLSKTEETHIIFYIVVCVLSIALAVMLILMVYYARWHISIMWFFEDICHWLGWNIGSYKEEPEDEEKG